MSRDTLPNRRPNETRMLIFGGMSFAVTIGFYPFDGRPGEVFASGAKSGCDLDYTNRKKSSRNRPSPSGY